MKIKQADVYIFDIYQGENQTMNKLFEYMDFSIEHILAAQLTCL